MNIQSSVLIRNLLILISILIIIIIYYTIYIGNKHIDHDKKIRINKKKTLLLITGLIFIYAICLVAKKHRILSDTIYTIIISAVFAYLLNPIVDYFEKHKITRGIGVFIIYLIIAGIIFILAFLIIPKTGREIKDSLIELQKYFEKVSKFLDGLYAKYYMNTYNMPPIFQSIEEVIFKNIDDIEERVIIIISKFFEGIISTFSKVVSLILIPILTFYFIKDKEYFKTKFYLSIPKKRRKEAKELFLQIDKSLSQFIRGRLLLALYVGIATTILLLILKVDFAIFIGMLTGIADIIPYFGPFIGFLPAVLFALLSSPIKALWVAILFIAIQWVENNVLAPKIIGKSTGIHPITILLALIIGGGIFGVMGMIFSIPVVAIIKILFVFFIEKIRKPDMLD